MSSSSQSTDLDQAVDDGDVTPACPVREQCPGTAWNDRKARFLEGFFDACGNDDCWPDGDGPDPDETVVYGRGRGKDRMHKLRGGE